MKTLLQEILEFCAQNKMAVTKFGLHALNDKAFVSQLENGRDIRHSTAERVRSFMSEYAPEAQEKTA